MADPIPVADVFLDTNILKFSALKKHAFRPRKEIINWGGLEHEIVVHDMVTTNDLHKIKNETQKRDAVFLGMLAYAGTSGQLKFHTHMEVELESWGLPGMASASGRFFGCPIHYVSDPVAPLSRIIAGGPNKPRDYVLDFLCGIEHPRYVELTKMTGAFQGKNKPLNLNQARDAFHIWCAECANMTYFLTMDYKLQKVVGAAKIKTSVSIKAPDQLLREVVPKLGLVGAIKFLWNGYKFAKPRIGFDEGKGWN